MDAKEKAAKIAEIERKLAELGKLRGQGTRNASLWKLK